MFDAKENMLSIGIPALRIISISFVFAGISIVLCSVFQALGHANPISVDYFVKTNGNFNTFNNGYWY